MARQKNELVILRLSSVEKVNLFRIAKTQGVSASEYLRQSIRIGESILVKTGKIKPESKRKIELAK